MTFLAGLAVGFIVGVVTIIVLAIIFAGNKRGRRE